MKHKTKIFIDDYPPEVLIKYQSEEPNDYICRASLVFWYAWIQGIQPEAYDRGKTIKESLVKVEVSGYLAKPIIKRIEKLHNWITDQLTTKDSSGKIKFVGFLEQLKMYPEKAKKAENIIYWILSAGDKTDE